MSIQQAISYLIVMLVAMILLAGVPNAMAGAYDTGEGHGYASCSGTEIVPNGTIFHVVRIQPNAWPILCNASDQSVLLRAVPVCFQTVMHYFYEGEMWL